MKQSISLSQFAQAFADHNREDNFSREGLRALYEWLEEICYETGQEYELDVIALCCDFTEYGRTVEAARAYDASIVVVVDACRYLQDHTPLIVFDGGVIIQNF